MLIGIIGLTDSGKDEVLQIITTANKNTTIINTNKIYSLLFSNPLYINELRKTFGQIILNKDKTISRDSLNLIVLRGSENSRKLHEIMARYGIKIIQDIQSQHSTQTDIIIDIGLLLNFGLSEICDKIIIPTATKETRAKRLAERAKISYEDALKRVSIQRELTYNNNNCMYITTDNCIDDGIKQELFNFIKK